MKEALIFLLLFTVYACIAITSLSVENESLRQEIRHLTGGR